jgi:7-cyano-7-deazaguanine tRNA-ribosyltransferase
MFVAGTQLRSRVDCWGPTAPYKVPGLEAVMVSFAEVFKRRPLFDRTADIGLGAHLGFEGRVFLDNGSFSLSDGNRSAAAQAYQEYVVRARPHWCPVPADFIPVPSMSRQVARQLAQRTHLINRRYGPLGFVPVIHIGPYFYQSLRAIVRHLAPSRIAIGGIVPHLRSSKRSNLSFALEALAIARSCMPGEIHVFGMGGGATSIHFAAALGIDSVDSSGWRIRAARGLIVIPGLGERAVGNSSNARKSTRLTSMERTLLRLCACPVCKSGGAESMSRPDGRGFIPRAIHNLWVLVKEVELINETRRTRDFVAWSQSRLATNRLMPALRYAHSVAARYTRLEAKQQGRDRI